MMNPNRLLRSLACGLALVVVNLVACVAPVDEGCYTDQDCTKNAAKKYCLKGFCSDKQCEAGDTRLCYQGPDGTEAKGQCRAGKQICLEEGLWSDCLEQVIPRPEVCDRVDNDCDGKIDEDISCDCKPGEQQRCYNGPVSTEAKGECRFGTQYCLPDNRWGNCIAQGEPQPEECDGKDNDCNGKIDDGISCDCEPGDKRACYNLPSGCAKSSELGFKCVGACTAGEQFCGTDRVWGECQKSVGPSEEICDGKDNDCDGEIDEDTKGVGEVCLAKGSLGICSFGKSLCKEGKVVCEPGKATDKEVCGNLIDDNCNGQIDESPPCGCTAGARRFCYKEGAVGCEQDQNGSFRCQGSCWVGEQFCLQDQTWGPCQGQILPKPEVCDLAGQDENCDGKVNETCECRPDEVRDCDTSLLGECKQGSQVCGKDGKWEACKSKASSQPEVCDKKDNNCDGQTDEGCECDPGDSRTCGTNTTGECKQGVQTCNTSGKWGKCFGEITPSNETCDGKDNDCNGTVDDGCECTPGDSRPCGNAPVGVCIQGTQSCRQNGKWGGCIGATQPSLEICDGKDNDCDGSVDEALQQDCYPAGVSGCVWRGNKWRCQGTCQIGTQACVNGQWEATCQTAKTPSSEICFDKVDNNCSGLVDDCCLPEASALVKSTNDDVLCLDWSPNGNWFVSCEGNDAVIRDASSGSVVRALRGHMGKVWGALFDPTSQIVYTAAADGFVRAWKVSDGSTIFNKKEHTDEVLGLAISPNGAMLASASKDDMVKLWDASTGTVTRTMSGHTGDVHTVAFSTNGQRLASGGADKSILIWQTSNGARLGTLTRHTDSVLSLAFHPKGWLFSASADNTLVQWDMTNNQHIRTFTVSSSIFHVKVSPNQGFIAASLSGGRVWLWETDTFQRQKDLLFGGGGDLLAFAWSPDSRQIAVGSKSKSIAVWACRP